MAVADLINSLKARGREAAKTARELAVAIVEGETVTDDAIAKACSAAAISFEHFADLVAKAEARKAAFDEFHARDFEAEMEQAVADYRQVVADRDAVKAELEALHGESRRLAELEQGLSGKRQRLVVEQAAAVAKFQAALGSSPRDWREF